MDPSYNNPFNTQPITSSGGGDIVLGGAAQPKKLKKGLIIGVVAAVFVVIVAVIVVVLMAGVGGGGLSLSEAFEDFENYMIVGPEEESNGNREDPYYEYVMWNYGYEKQEEYFNEAKERLDKLEKASSGETKNIVQELAQYLLFFRANAEISRTDILDKKYLENRTTGIKDYVEGFVEAGLVNEYALRLYDTTMALAEESQKLFSIYYDKGCVKNDGMDSECLTRAVDSDARVMDQVKKVQKLKQTVSRDNGYVGERILSRINGLAEVVGNEE